MPRLQIHPEISVLLPVYNAEKYLGETLQSLLNQTFKNFEIVLMDDGSTDRSVEIAEKFQDPRIKIYRNPENLGLVATLNRGLELSTGEFIARIDADDIALPERLEKQLSFMKTHPDCILLASDRALIDENGIALPSFTSQPRDPEIISWKLLTGNFITHPSVMLKKSLLPQNLFQEDYKHAEDYAAWLTICNLGTFQFLNERLIKYRLHPKSISKMHTETQVNSANRSLLKYLKKTYNQEFSTESLAMWTTPQEAANYPMKADFYELLTWMNPLNKRFRQNWNFKLTLIALSHYYRRLILLSCIFRKRPEVLWILAKALATSIFNFL